MSAPDRHQIESEIQRLESRRAEITRQLNVQSSVTALRFLSEDLMLTDRTLIVLRQQHARHIISVDPGKGPAN